MINGETAYHFAKIGVTADSVGIPSEFGGIKACRALVTVESNSIRFRYDGGDPSTSEGHLITTGITFAIEGYADIARFRCIRNGTSNAAICVTLEHL